MRTIIELGNILEENVKVELTEDETQMMVWEHFNPVRNELKWNEERTKATIVALRWHDEGSYNEYQYDDAFEDDYGDLSEYDQADEILAGYELDLIDEEDLPF